MSVRRNVAFRILETKKDVGNIPVQKFFDLRTETPDFKTPCCLWDWAYFKSVCPFCQNKKDLDLDDNG